MNIITYENVESKIIEIRGAKTILDSHVAELYGVETKRINEAVSRNEDKFSEGYTGVKKLFLFTAFQKVFDQIYQRMKRKFIEKLLKI